MRIHISEPCKQLLSAQYKCEQRDDPAIREKVGGHVSHFLTAKDGRQPLRPEVIKALLPTASEMPSVGKGKKEEKKEEKKADPPKNEEEKKDEAPKADKTAPKADAPASKAEAKKVDEQSPSSVPTVAPATTKSSGSETAAAPAADDTSAPAKETSAVEEATATVESAPGEVYIPIYVKSYILEFLITTYEIVSNFLIF